MEYLGNILVYVIEHSFYGVHAFIEMGPIELTNCSFIVQASVHVDWILEYLKLGI